MYLTLGTVVLAAPSSCLVTEWGDWDACSATCGLGMKRRERMVKMPPSDGSLCSVEVAEVEKCMMPECREYPQSPQSVVPTTLSAFNTNYPLSLQYP